MTAQDYKAPESVTRLEKRALVVGMLGLLGCIAGWITSPEVFFRSYLLGFLVVLGLSLGCLGVLMMQHLTGGHWGIIIRRPLEAGSRVLWLVAGFFIPLIFGMKFLFTNHVVAGEPRMGWMDPGVQYPAEGGLSQMQSWWLTHNAVLGRAALYFVIWIGLALLFNSLSAEQDGNKDDRKLRARIKFFAGPGIILYVFGMSFFAIDWAMSLSPHWASTIYGFMFVAGQAISAMSLMILMVAMFSGSEPFSHIVQERHLHDLGKLLFAFNMLWAYFSFSQLLIIWSGNQPEEITFYHHRLQGAWGVVAVGVCVFHFFLPFLFLLSHDLKRNRKLIPIVAAWMIAMRVLDIYWLTQPEFLSSPFEKPIAVVWDLVALFGLGGLWLWFFAGQLKRRPLLPLGDPKLSEAIANNEH
ncbi:MAG TPA: hypothetical protein VEU98_09135 [Candidatus Eremiobacteraceae bacterium]|nr:hypothetical protein [Candidatus Eremiobacteraceae bacterium]